jgi:hypothetical protein
MLTKLGASFFFFRIRQQLGASSWSNERPGRRHQPRDKVVRLPFGSARKLATETSTALLLFECLFDRVVFRRQAPCSSACIVFVQSKLNGEGRLMYTVSSSPHHWAKQRGGVILNGPVCCQPPITDRRDSGRQHPGPFGARWSSNWIGARLARDEDQCWISFLSGRRHRPAVGNLVQPLWLSRLVLLQCSADAIWYVCYAITCLTTASRWLG